MKLGRRGDDSAVDTPENPVNQTEDLSEEETPRQIRLEELQVTRVEFIDEGDGDFRVVVDLSDYEVRQLSDVIGELEALDGVTEVLVVTDGFAVTIEDDCDHASVLQNLRRYTNSGKALLAELSNQLVRASGIDVVKGRQGKDEDDIIVLEFSPLYAGNDKRATRAARTAAHHAAIQVELVKAGTEQTASSPVAGIADILGMIFGDEQLSGLGYRV